MWRARPTLSLGPFEDIEILEWEGFVPDLSDKDYVAQLKARMADRLNYVTSLDTAEGGFNKLPADAAGGHPQGGGRGQQPVNLHFLIPERPLRENGAAFLCQFSTVSRAG